MTDPKHRSPVASDYGSEDGHDQPDQFAYVYDVESIVDSVCDGCDLKLSFIVFEGGRVGESDKINEVVEDEGQTSDEWELLWVVFEDEGDDIREADVGGDQQEEEDSH